MSTDLADHSIPLDDSDPAVTIAPRSERAPSAWSQAPGWLMPALVACVVAAAFVNSIPGAFVLDDPSSITDNELIKDVFNLQKIAFNPRRFVVYFSFAVNWALSGYQPGPYHLVNIFIHVAAAVVLYDIVRLALLSPRLAPRFGREAPALAAAIAILWGVHPLQTQSVTYIVQRTESLMGLFFLLVLWFTARGARAPAPNSLWLYAGAAVSCWLGVFTKEVMIVAPATLLLFDLTILSRNWREPFTQRWGLYLVCFLSSVALVAMSRETFSKESHAMGFGSTLISKENFAKTQPEVILHYIKLSFWPQDLCIDYRWPVQEDGFKIALAAFALGSLFGASVLALYLSPPLGFVGMFFFFTLAPSSSVIPIIDLAFEHRMYLALATPVVLAVLTFWTLWNAFVDVYYPYFEKLRLTVPLVCLALVALALSTRTMIRNVDYYSAERLWRDVVRQRPDNPRAFHNLAVELENSQRPAEAAPIYKEAIALGEKSTGHPLYKYHFNYGISLKKLNRWEEAAYEFGEAARLSSNPYAEAYSNRGFALAELHRTGEAIDALKKAVSIKDSLDYAEAKLAELLADAGRYQEAINHANPVLASEPNNSAVRLARARAYCGLGEFAKARADYDEASKTDGYELNATELPRRLTAKAELTWLLAACPDEENQFPQRAVRLAEELLQPTAKSDTTNDVVARDALAAALAAQGEFDDAAEAAELAADDAELIGDVTSARRIRERRDRYLRQEAFQFTPAPDDPLGR